MRVRSGVRSLEKPAIKCCVYVVSPEVPIHYPPPRQATVTFCLLCLIAVTPSSSPLSLCAFVCAPFAAAFIRLALCPSARTCPTWRMLDISHIRILA